MEYVRYKADLLPTFLAVTGAALRWVACYSGVGDGISSTKCQQMLIEVANESPNVEKLEMQGGQWDHQFGTVMMTLQKLIYLSMAFVDITTVNLGRALSECKCLEMLILDVACELPVEVAVPTLKLIRVQHPRCVTAAVFTTICQNCTKLETLMVFDSSRLNGRLFITDAGARALLEGCPLLRHTDVEHISGISTAIRVELAKRCNLKRYSLGIGAILMTS
jgi:hypothetical protein